MPPAGTLFRKVAPCGSAAGPVRARSTRPVGRSPLKLRKAAATVPVLPGVKAGGSALTATKPWYGAVASVSYTRWAVRYASPVSRTG